MKNGPSPRASSVSLTRAPGLKHQPPSPPGRPAEGLRAALAGAELARGRPSRRGHRGARWGRQPVGRAKVLEGHPSRPPSGADRPLGHRLLLGGLRMGNQEPPVLALPPLKTPSSGTCRNGRKPAGLLGTWALPGPGSMTVTTRKRTTWRPQAGWSLGSGKTWSQGPRSPKS